MTSEPELVQKKIAGSREPRRQLAGQGENISQPGWYTWSLGYGYDRNGHLANHVYPSDLVVDYAPNALGQATKAGSFATGATYHPNGALKQFTYGNGLVHTTTQNTRGLPFEVCDATGPCGQLGTTATVFDTHYYDPNANLVAITDGATRQAQHGNRDMAYDALDRLIEASAPDMFGTATYVYDVLDNLTHVKVDAGPTTRDHWYCYDARNQLTNVKEDGCSIGATVIGLGYDERGNLDNRNGVDYVFDHGNRLTKIPGVESYRYDGLGRRVLSWSAQGLGNLLSQYSKEGRLVYQHDERVGKALEHVHLAGRLVARRERTIPGDTNVTVTYLHTDALGSPVAATNATGTPIQRSDYEPYGQLANRASDNRPGHTGHVMDALIGLTYMEQRFYDPAIGMFLSVDPVTAYSNPIGQFHRYRYANNNPYKFMDPDGRLSFLVSRPLNGPGEIVGNHNFIVHDADSVGDPGAVVRSWGIKDGETGTMGRVNSTTEGPNASTHAVDRAAWESLSGETGDVTYREIDAPDEVVAENASRVPGGYNYSYVPEVSGGANSNTAAGAVAQESDGGSPRVDNGRPQPGTSQERVDALKENFMIPRNQEP